MLRNAGIEEATLTFVGYGQTGVARLIPQSLIHTFKDAWTRGQDSTEEGTRAIRMPMNSRAPNQNPFEISQTNLDERIIVKS